MVHPYTYPTSHLKRLLLSDVSDIVKCQIQILSRHFWISNLNNLEAGHGAGLSIVPPMPTRPMKTGLGLLKSSTRPAEISWAERGKSQIYTTREGYRNVIFEDPALEGASEAMIRSRHTQWVEDQGHRIGMPVPRFTYPLLLDDRSVRSILASAPPRNPDVR
ncbi:hypothetical protein N7467_012086 [Penicillium canescens]|nr:hypothetical protein N7467_012086 [Penicillium canescens]